jgi:hypothetical protein
MRCQNKDIKNRVDHQNACIQNLLITKTKMINKKIIINANVQNIPSGQMAH